MRIAIVAPAASRAGSPGGRGHFNEKLSRVLAAHGHTVYILYSTVSTPTRRREAGITWVGVNSVKLARVFKALTFRRLPMTTSTLAFNISTRRVLKKIKRVEGLDVVHCTLNHATGFLHVVLPVSETVLRCSAHMPTVNRLKYRFDIDSRLTARLESLSLKRATTVYAPSKRIADLYDESFAARAHRRVIPTPIDPELVLPANRPRCTPGNILFFTAFLEELKGIYDLAAAIEVLAPRFPDVRLRVAGRATREKGEDTIKRMKLVAGQASDRLDFIGYVERETLVSEILRADVVALPSHFDNLPNALLEAMWLGSIVVGTTGSSLDEVIEHGVNGFLCPARDPQALAAAIELALTSQDREAVRANARASMERNFTPNAFVRAFEDLVCNAPPLKRTD